MSRILVWSVLIVGLVIGLSDAQPVSRTLIRWSSDNSTLAIAADGQVIRYQDGQTTMTNSYTEITDLFVKSDSVWFTTAQGEIIVWRADDSIEQTTTMIPDYVRAMFWNSTENRVLVYTADPQNLTGLYLYDTDLTFLAAYFPLPVGGPVPFFEPSGAVLDTIWDNQTLIIQRDFDPLYRVTFDPTLDRMETSFFLASDGRYVLAQPARQDDLSVYDAEADQFLYTLTDIEEVWRIYDQCFLVLRDGIWQLIDSATGEVIYSADHDIDEHWFTPEATLLYQDGVLTLNRPCEGQTLNLDLGDFSIFTLICTGSGSC